MKKLPLTLIQIISIIIFAFGLFLHLEQPLLSAPSNKILTIQLDDNTINPITSEYIAQAIDKATDENYSLLVIQMDTPGGLLSSTRTIVKKILVAEIPVVIYISPSGSRAGSAGVFITYASHIAVMAPSTNIGAAHPVNIGGVKDPKRQNDWESVKELLSDFKEKTEKSQKESPEGEQEEAGKMNPEETQEGISPDTNPLNTKILQDTVAFIKTLAKTRDRNVEWAIESVVQSKSITNDEALEKGVIDYVARDMNELLQKINGHQVVLIGKTVTIDTTDAMIEKMEMDSRQRFFNILADPNIAYILMILGFYGLLFEVTHPGFGIPGVLGIIFLILAFYSMQTLPTNYAGLALIILGLTFLIAEAYVPGFGIFSFAGLVCLVLGSMMLFKSVDPIMKVSRSLIISFSLATTLITLLLLQMSIKSFKAKVISGSQGLVGSIAETKSDFTEQGKGKVFIHGELWDAQSTFKIKKGEEVLVKEVNGLKLIIEPLTKKEDV